MSRFDNDPWGENLLPGDVYQVACKIDGKVIWAPRPCRHHVILVIAHQLGFPTILGEDQGFILKDGTWVDRKTAADIAIKSGQVKKLIAPPNLYSEDLF